MTIPNKSLLKQTEQDFDLNQLHRQWPKEPEEQKQWLLQFTKENLTKLIQYLAQTSKNQDLLTKDKELIQQIIKSLLQHTTPLLRLAADTKAQDPKEILINVTNLEKTLDDLCAAYNKTLPDSMRKFAIIRDQVTKNRFDVLQDLFMKSDNSDDLNKFIINVLPSQPKLIGDTNFINKLKKNLEVNFIKFFIGAIKTDKLSEAINSLRINSKQDFADLYQLVTENNSKAPATIALIFANMAQVSLNAQNVIKKIKEEFVDPKNQSAFIAFLQLAAKNNKLKEAIDGIGIKSNLEDIFFKPSGDLRDNAKFKQLIGFLLKTSNDTLSAEPINSLKQNLIADKLLLFALLNASSQEQGPEILTKLGLNETDIQTLFQEKESLLTLTCGLVAINTDSYFWSCVSQSSTAEPLMSPEKKINEFKQKLFLPNNKSQLFEFLLTAEQNNKLAEIIQKLDIETQLKNLLTDNKNLALLAQLWAYMPKSATQQLTGQKDIEAVKAQLLESANLPQLLDLLRTTTKDSELLNKLGINSYLEQLFLKENEFEIFLRTSNTDHAKPELLVEFLSKAPSAILNQNPIKSLKNNLIDDNSLLFTLLLAAATKNKLSEIITKLNITAKLTDFFTKNENLVELVYLLACMPDKDEEITKLCEIAGQKDIQNLEAAQKYIKQSENYPLLTKLLEKAATNNNLAMVIEKLKLDSSDLYLFNGDANLLEKNIKLLASKLDLKTLLPLLYLNDIAWSVANNNSSQLNNEDIQQIKTKLLASDNTSQLFAFLNKAKQNNALLSAIGRLDIGLDLENLLQDPVRLLSFLMQMPPKSDLLNIDPIKSHVDKFTNNATGLLDLLKIAVEKDKLSLIAEKSAIKDKLTALFNNSNLEALARILMSIQNNPTAKLTLLRTVGQENLEAFKARFLALDNQQQLKNFLAEIAKNYLSLSLFVKALEITNDLDALTPSQESADQKIKLQQIETFLRCLPDGTDSEVIQEIKAKLQAATLPTLSSRSEVSQIQESIERDTNSEISEQSLGSMQSKTEEELRSPSFSTTEKYTPFAIVESKESEQITRFINANSESFKRYIAANKTKKPWGAKKQIDGHIKTYTNHIKEIAASAQKYQYITQAIDQLKSTPANGALNPYLRTATNQAVNFMQLHLQKLDDTNNSNQSHLTDLCLAVVDPVNPTEAEKKSIKRALRLYLADIVPDSILNNEVIKLQQAINAKKMPLPQTDNPQIDLAMAILSRARRGIIKKGDFEITRSLQDVSGYIKALKLQPYTGQYDQKESGNILSDENQSEIDSVATAKYTPVSIQHGFSSCK